MCSGEGACAVALDSNPPGPPANGQNLVRSRCGKPHVALMPRGRKGTCMDMAPTDDMKSSREFTAGSGRLPTTKRAADVTSAQLTSVSTRTTDQRVRRARAVQCARTVGCEHMHVRTRSSVAMRCVQPAIGTQCLHANCARTAPRAVARQRGGQRAHCQVV